MEAIIGLTVMAIGAGREGLQWLSPTQMLNLNHMAMAMAMATTGHTDTGAGERKRGLQWLSPMQMLNLNHMAMAMAMVTTGHTDTGAGERRKGLLNHHRTMDMDMATAVATMADTVEDIGAKS